VALPERAAPAARDPLPAAPDPEPADTPPANEPAASAPPTRIVDKPLRSGQRVYAAGDIVILAAVNPGAEVIADGNIHVYAPLMGRALAGARGATDARIFAQKLEAELVSIAGVYRTFEHGADKDFSGRPVQVRLGADSSLEIVPL
ncbi:MAG: septum site-determining protein MinC, partial [Thiobacillus sp.]|nr:septum site-determining protein MinC [Thiobacillus sp.]